MAAHSSLTHREPPRPVRLKRTDAFQAVYRRGRWTKGTQLSVGALPNRERVTRVGLRTRRGIKGAAVRNRLKRQLRDLVFNRRLPLRAGLDVIIVIHPRQFPLSSAQVNEELRTLCKRNGCLAV